MASASILVKNAFPIPSDSFIPLTTVFSFEIIPYNGASIDITTLTIKVIVSGGTTGMTRTFDLAYNDPSITYTGTNAKGYKISIDLFPNFDLNFDSNESVQLRINASDTSAVAMRTIILDYTALNLEMYDALSDLLHEVTEVPVDYEQGRLNLDGTVVDLTHRNWSINIDPKVYLNDVLITSGFTVDKVHGKITFTTPLRIGDITGYGYTSGSDDFFDAVDRVNVDYKFSAFSDTQLVSFMKTALGYFNGFRPQSAFTLRNSPLYVKYAALLGAAYYAIDFLLLGFINQQFRVIWGDEDNWQNLTSILTTLKENYKGQFEKVAEEKRYKLAHVVSVVEPSFSLPGSRSRFFRYLYKEGGSA